MTTLPSEGFVRLGRVLEVIPVSRSTFYERMAAGEYPRPVKLAGNVAAWRVEDIRALIRRLSGEAEVTA